MNLLEIKNLKKEFIIHHAEKHIKSCDDVNFALREGAFIGIVGRSGAGKSTVLRCIYRTYLPTAGNIWFQSAQFGRVDLAVTDERHILSLRQQEIGYVSQFLNIMPRVTAREHVETALLSVGATPEDAKKRATEMLAYFRLPTSLWDIYPNTFSGGERLRLNLAHAMVKKPRLLLLDEPTASLDDQTKLLVKDLLLSLKGNGTSMLGIFHDLAFMDGVCDEVYRLQDGKMEKVLE